MRTLDLARPRPCAGQEARLARLTRHLKARLLDFDPGGPEVISSDQATGRVTARLPGWTDRAFASALADRGIEAGLTDSGVEFRLSPDISFEDLDYLWGCINEIL